MYRFFGLVLIVLMTSIIACEDEDSFTDSECSPLTSITCSTAWGERCPDGYFCWYAQGVCNDPEAEGRCARIPLYCAYEFEPVCGCDGKLYVNSCDASSFGLSLDHFEACFDNPLDAGI